MENIAPLSEIYDSRQILTDTIYSNTILSSGQTDSYSFSVKDEGKYKISVPEGSNIEGRLYLEEDEEPIFTNVELSDINTISCYLSKEAIYRLEIISQSIGAYSFVITKDESAQTLPLTTLKMSDIKYSKDKVIYTFVPDEDGMYFFEAKGDMYPTIELLNDNNDILKFSGNLEYIKTNVLNYELKANKLYFIKVGSQKGEPFAVSVYVKKINIVIDGNNVAIHRKCDIIAKARCALSIYDVNELVRIAQMNTTSNGTFRYSTTLEMNAGAYQCIINQDTQTTPICFIFGNGNSINTTNKHTDVVTLKGASVTPTFGTSRLTANTDIKADIHIKNSICF